MKLLFSIIDHDTRIFQSHLGEKKKETKTFTPYNLHIFFNQYMLYYNLHFFLSTRIILLFRILSNTSIYNNSSSQFLESKLHKLNYKKNGKQSTKSLLKGRKLFCSNFLKYYFGYLEKQKREKKKETKNRKCFERIWYMKQTRNITTE